MTDEDKIWLYGTIRSAFVDNYFYKGTKIANVNRFLTKYQKINPASYEQHLASLARKKLGVG
jgi:hypothetical protein